MDELGHCPRCELTAAGWRLCSEHRPDKRPKALDPRPHLAAARRALHSAPRRWESEDL